MTGDPTLRALFVDEGVLGGETLMTQLRSGLSNETQVEATFATVPPGNRLERLLLRRFERIGHADMQMLRWRLRWSWHARRLLERQLGQTDVALINTPASALLSAGPMRRLPCVLSVDATARQYAALGYGGARDRWTGTQEKMLFALERRAIAGAAGVIALTEWNADALRREHGLPAERLVTLHPGLDANWWSQAAGRRSHRREGPLRILFVGNDVRRKGLATLRNAVERLGDAVELDVATGDDVEPGPRLHVHHGLSIQSDGMRDLYERADVFALPTEADAVPWVVLEAMAAGLPVVASDVGAIGELIDGCGELVRPGDVDGLAAALERLADAPDRGRALGERALDRVRERYDRTRQVPLLLDVLRAAAAGGPLPVQVGS